MMHDAARDAALIRWIRKNQPFRVNYKWLDNLAKTRESGEWVPEIELDPMYHERRNCQQCLQSDNDELCRQLAAEQAKNVVLRVLLQNLVDSSVICCAHFKTDHDAAIQGLQDILSDTSALEAIIKKAGEVMRDRFRIAEAQGWLNREFIRTIPAVTIDDLKGE